MGSQVIQIGLNPTTAAGTGEKAPRRLATRENLNLQRKLSSTAESGDVQSLALLILLSPEASWDAHNVHVAFRGLAKLKDQPPTQDYRRATQKLFNMVDKHLTEFPAWYVALVLHSITNSKSLLSEVEKFPSSRASLAGLLRRAFEGKYVWSELDTIAASKFMAAVGNLSKKNMPEIRAVFKECENLHPRVLSEVVTPQLAKFTPSQLTQALWANGQLPKYSENMCKQAVNVILSSPTKLANYTAKDLSVLMWAYAKQLARPKPDFLHLIDCAVGEKYEEILTVHSAKEMTGVFWSMACLGISNPEHLKRYLGKLHAEEAGFDTFDMKSVANLALAVQTYQYMDVQTLRALASAFIRLAGKVETKESKHVLTVLFTFATLASQGSLQVPEVKRCFESTFNAKFLVDQTSVENAKMLKQCQLAWQHEFGSQSRVPNALWVMGGKWVDTLIAEDTKTVNATTYSTEILEVCKRLGYAEAIQNCVTSTGFCVDLFVHDNVLIEVVPVFGLLSDLKTLTGKQQLKQRLIEQEGFKVINVPVHEWRNLYMNKSAQIEYLTQKLSSA